MYQSVLDSYVAFFFLFFLFFFCFNFRGLDRYMTIYNSGLFTGGHVIYHEF